MSDDDVRRIVEDAGTDLSSAQRARLRGGLQAALDGETRAAGPSPNRWLRWGLVAAVVVALVVGVVVVRNRSDDSELAPATEPTTSTTPQPETTVTTPTSPSTTVEPSTEPSTTPTTAAPTTSAPPTTTAPSTTTVAPPAVAPPALLLPAGLRVVALAQPATHVAWVVASDPTNGGPSMLLHSTDDGQTWRNVNLPDALGDQASVVFADARNGWTLGANALLATHDGGATWASVVTSGEAPQAVTASGGLVHVFSFDGGGSKPAFKILSSPVGTDTFQPSGVTMQPGAGPVVDASVASSTSASWLMYNDRQLIDAARFDGGAWTKWMTPCSVGGNGVPPAESGLVASSRDGGLVVVCTTSPFYSPPSVVRVFTSGDNGATFRMTSPLPDAAQTVTDGTQAPAQATVVVAPSPTTMYVGYTATDGTSRFVVSGDGGATWVATAPFLAADPLAAAFVVDDGGVLVTTQSQHSYSTHDAGQSWTDVTGGVVVH